MAYTGNFQPPGPGSWERESTHMSRPISRWLGAFMVPAFIRGFRESMSTYGMPLDCIEPAIVEGFMYLAARPVGAPKGAKGPPPKPIFKLLTWLHAALRDDPNARALLEKDAPPKETLDALVAGSGPTAKAARAYLDAVGLRVISGYDVADRCAIEMPEILVRAIRSALAGDVVSREN